MAIASVIGFVVFIGVFIQMMLTAPLSLSNLSLDEFMIRSVLVSLALSASFGIIAYVYLRRGLKIYMVNTSYTSRVAKKICKDLGLDKHTGSAYLLAMKYLNPETFERLKESL